MAALWCERLHASRCEAWHDPHAALPTNCSAGCGRALRRNSEAIYVKLKRGARTAAKATMTNATAVPSTAVRPTDRRAFGALVCVRVTRRGDTFFFDTTNSSRDSRTFAGQVRSDHETLVGAKEGRRHRVVASATRGRRYISAGLQGTHPSGRVRMDLRDRLHETLGTTYLVERELGGGGMSRVFVAMERALERRVVIKVLSPDLAAGLSAQRFTREIRLAAALQQANVVPVLATGEADGLPFYVMPFIAGLSLRDRLDRDGRLGFPAGVGVMRDVLRALAYAHDHG